MQPEPHRASRIQCCACAVPPSWRLVQQGRTGNGLLGMSGGQGSEATSWTCHF